MLCWFRMHGLNSAFVILDMLLFCCIQVICWILGEYGTADGKYSGSYISGKLCDVAEVHPNDDIVKVYLLALCMCTRRFT